MKIPYPKKLTFFLYTHATTPHTSDPSPKHLYHLTKMATATSIYHQKPKAFRERGRERGREWVK